MPTEKQKRRLVRGLALAAAGTFAIGLAGCVDPYPPPPPQAAVTTDGFYSYYDYPDTYYYYDNNGYRMRGGYSDDPNLRYDARERSPWHSDDHNFHNRSDFDHWDY